MKKIKYKAIFVKHIQNGYNYLGKRKFEISNKSLNFKQYKIPIENITGIEPYSKKFTRYYFIDIDSGLIRFKENPSKIDFELVNLFVGKALYRNIISSIFGNTFSNIIQLIIGGVAGIFAGLFIGVYIL